MQTKHASSYINDNIGCNALLTKLLLPGHACLQQMNRCCPASFITYETQREQDAGFCMGSTIQTPKNLALNQPAVIASCICSSLVHLMQWHAWREVPSSILTPQHQQG